MQNYTAKSWDVNSKPIKGFSAIKIGMAGFFAVHYGMFHLVYLIFILTFAVIPFASGSAAGIDFLSVLITGAIFFANHLFSFLYNYKREINYSNTVTGLSKTMFAPYAGIVPMHLTIIFGFGFVMIFPHSIFPVLLFMVLKTGADLAMHKNKHLATNMATNG